LAAQSLASAASELLYDMLGKLWQSRRLSNATMVFRTISGGHSSEGMRTKIFSRWVWSEFFFISERIPESGKLSLLLIVLSIGGTTTSSNNKEELTSGLTLQLAVGSIGSMGVCEAMSSSSKFRGGGVGFAVVVLSVVDDGKPVVEGPPVTIGSVALVGSTVTVGSVVLATSTSSDLGFGGLLHRTGSLVLVGSVVATVGSTVTVGSEEGAPVFLGELSKAVFSVPQLQKPMRRRRLRS